MIPSSQALQICRPDNGRRYRPGHYRWDRQWSGERYQSPGKRPAPPANWFCTQLRPFGICGRGSYCWLFDIEIDCDSHTHRLDDVKRIGLIQSSARSYEGIQDYESSVTPPYPGHLLPPPGCPGAPVLETENKNNQRWVALITSLVTFGISLVVLAWFIELKPEPRRTPHGTSMPPGSRSLAGISATPWAWMG